MPELPPPGPSPHLSWAELACKDGTPYPQKWRMDRAVELALAFETIRELCGFPILISSAYRTPEYNARINGGQGGAKNSQHCEGRALDLAPPRPPQLWALRLAVIKARQRGLIRGIGLYRGFIHIDTRPGRNATWTGDRGVDGNIPL